MGRNKGTFKISGNFEPRLKAPFDAREEVDTFSDLTSSSTWEDEDGNIWLYNGLSVFVRDEKKKYLLIDRDNYDLDASWEEMSVDPDKFYKFVQGVPSASWSVNHNLNKRPAVTVVDSAFREVIGNVEYIDDNNVLLTFSDPFSGEAYFN